MTYCEQCGKVEKALSSKDIKKKLNIQIKEVGKIVLEIIMAQSKSNISTLLSIDDGFGQSQKLVARAQGLLEDALKEIK